MAVLTGRTGAAAAALLLAALAAPPALANDRPFQSARTAVAEDDDEGTWSVESWLQRRGRVRAFSIEPEHGFTPYTSMQLELTRLVDRSGDETGHEAEVEFKHLFNHIGRDGYGLGISVALTGERARADGTRRALTLKLPLSVAVGETGALVHLDVGVFKVRGERRESTVSAAAEGDLAPRWRGFAEWAHEGRERFGQIGVRRWLQRDRLALDVAWQRRRGDDGTRAAGVIVGVGWYDL